MTWDDMQAIGLTFASYSKPSDGALNLGETVRAFYDGRILRVCKCLCVGPSSSPDVGRAHTWDPQERRMYTRHNDGDRWQPVIAYATPEQLIRDWNISLHKWEIVDQ